MKVIIHNNNGMATIISPSQKVDVNECLSAVPEGCEYKIVDISEIPQDKDFKHAMKYDLTFDIEKCKEIQKDKIRIDRAEKLKELDYQFMLALEQGKDYTEITKAKQVLRDLPQKVDACKTIEEIKKVEV